MHNFKVRIYLYTDGNGDKALNFEFATNLQAITRCSIALKQDKKFK